MRALGALAHVARDQGREGEGLELLEAAVRVGRLQDGPVAVALGVTAGVEECDEHLRPDQTGS